MFSFLHHLLRSNSTQIDKKRFGQAMLILIPMIPSWNLEKTASFYLPSSANERSWLMIEFSSHFFIIAIVIAEQITGITAENGIRKKRINGYKA